MKDSKCLSCAPPLHRPDENVENYAHPPERLRTLTDLVDAAFAMKLVFCPNSCVWGRPRSAAFVINLSGITLHRLLNQGIYLYDKQRK
jgi:hypothetical protein